MINSKYKTLISNFSALSILQLANYFFPLITVPYLVRVLGPENYGLINFAAAFAMFFVIITNYGFNISATKEISTNRSDANKVSRIFWSVIYIKVILMLVCTLIFAFLINTITKFYDHQMIYYFSFLAIIGFVFFPVWFFQGMEKMKYISIINLAVKLIWVPSVFIFIKSEKDLLTLVLFNSISQILIGVVSLFVIFKIFKIQILIPNFADIKNQLTEGWYLFLSNASITIFTNANVFLLGVFSTNEIVGYFTAADKMRMAIQNLFSTAAQTTFPYLSNLFKKTYKEAIIFVRRYLMLITVSSLTVIFICFLFAYEIVSFFLGSQYLQSINLFRIIIFLPFIIMLSNIFGIQVMINLGYQKQFSKIIIAASILHLIVSFIIVPKYLAIGTSVSVLITEIFVTVGLYIFLRKNNILFYDKKLKNY